MSSIEEHRQGSGMQWGQQREDRHQQELWHMYRQEWYKACSRSSRGEQECPECTIFVTKRDGPYGAEQPHPGSDVESQGPSWRTLS